MKIQDFIIEEINGRQVVVRGIGKMFYQDGFPIGIAVEKLRDMGIEVSWLHIADELQKNGWKARTILSRIGEDLADYGDELDAKAILTTIELFLSVEYELQREMIFHSLFDGDMKMAKTFLMEKLFAGNESNP